MNINWDNLTYKEKYIIKLIIGNRKEVSSMNMKELAKFTHSSLGAISRLFSKLGFDGYKEFKKKISQTDDMQLSKIKKEVSTLQEIIDHSFLELKKTIEILNYNFVENIVNGIKKSKKIFIYAKGISMFPALFLAQKLIALGKSATVYEDSQMMELSIKHHTKDSLIIILSNSSSTKVIVDIVNKSLSKGTLKKNIFLLTANQNGELIKTIKNTQLVFVEKPLTNNIDLKSRVEIYLICKIILNYYIEKYL